jgi:hypothetical protein
LNAFHVIGGLTAIWAVLVAILGITREDFPRGGAEKIVGAISLLLVVGTISAAIVTASTEDSEEGGDHGAATETEH